MFQKRLRYHDEKGVRENLDKAEGVVDPVSGERHRQLFRQTEDAIVFISHGYSPDDLRQFSPPANGLYRIRASAYAVDSRQETVALKVYSSDWKTSRMLRYFELREGVPRIVEFTTRLTPRIIFDSPGTGSVSTARQECVERRDGQGLESSWNGT